jgi:DNA helicase-4
MLRDLLESWYGWEANRAYYLHQLLPQLKEDTGNAETQERRLMQKLRRTASPVEWQRLEWIAENLEVQEQRWWAFSQELESLLENGALGKAERFASQFGNPSLVEWCEARKQDTRRRVAERIERFLEAGDLIAAEQTLRKYRSAFSDAQCTKWMRRIGSQRKANDISRVRAEIKEDLRHFDFDGAEQLYADLKTRYPEAAITEYDELISQARRSQLDANLRRRLEEFKFEEARRLFEENRTLISSDEFHQLVEEYRHRHEIASLTRSLQNFRFVDADDQFTACEHVSRQEYEALKAEYITQYAKSHFPLMPDDEQALALASTSCNLLIQARAGSGKTRVAAQKAALLLQDSVGNPDEILILAFNHDAARQIGRRIRQRYGFDQYGNARTFHSLAWRLVCPEQDLLFDDRDRGLPGMEQSQFVQDDVIAELMNPVFRERMYAFFREDLVAIEDAGLLLPQDEYYIYRRNLRQRTLRGDLVESRGEKWIADFLFEHDIGYKYESVRMWGGELYRPDFWVGCVDKDYIIEHWAIDEYHKEELPGWWTKTWEDYRQEMDRKRNYWEEKGIPLIETSVADMRAGREQFEAVFRQRLEEVGITCHKLPQEKLYDRVKPIHLSSFAKKATQFIQRAKKKGLSPTGIEEKVAHFDPPDERTSVFLRLATRIYRDYEHRKEEDCKIDFDDLLLEATQVVHSTEGKCSFLVDHQRPVRVSDLRWIIIDEFQDFSPLFNDLIEAIRFYNPGVRLFCVGDDWQAINGFAGSDLAFFEGFEERYDESDRAHLLTNHRSRKSVVQQSNVLMRGLGPPARPRDDAPPGLAQIEPIDDVWVELRSQENFADAYDSDRRFRFSDKKGNTDVLASRYLKRCYELMTAPENIGRKAAILSRTNRIYSIPLLRFERKLIACLTEEEKQQFEDPREAVRVSTVHSFKGLEEEIVILVRACEGSFPLLHPDNSLFTLFGRDEADVLNEERRLFYVAMTRAKRRLYILTERDRESPFLKQLPAYDAYQREHT